MRKPASSSSDQSPAEAMEAAAWKRGPWTPEEDKILSEFIRREGEGRWRTLPKRAGLLRCGKSCRLRWMNYLRPSINHGDILPEEEDLILRLHRLLGNRWSLIAGRIPGRTDNEIKNYWNTHLRKKLISNGIDPHTHKSLNHENINTKSKPLRIVKTLNNLNPYPKSFCHGEIHDSFSTATYTGINLQSSQAKNIQASGLQEACNSEDGCDYSFFFDSLIYDEIMFPHQNDQELNKSKQ